jgi:hypothetical protein
MSANPPRYHYTLTDSQPPSQLSLRHTCTPTRRLCLVNHVASASSNARVACSKCVGAPNCGSHMPSLRGTDYLRFLLVLLVVSMNSETAAAAVNCGADSNLNGALSATELAAWRSAKNWGANIPPYARIHFFILTNLLPSEFVAANSNQC